MFSNIKDGGKKHIRLTRLRINLAQRQLRDEYTNDTAQAACCVRNKIQVSYLHIYTQLKISIYIQIFPHEIFLKGRTTGSHKALLA